MDGLDQDDNLNNEAVRHIFLKIFVVFMSVELFLCFVIGSFVSFNFFGFVVISLLTAFLSSYEAKKIYLDQVKPYQTGNSLRSKIISIQKGLHGWQHLELEINGRCVKMTLGFRPILRSHDLPEEGEDIYVFVSDDWSKAMPDIGYMKKKWSLRRDVI